MPFYPEQAAREGVPTAPASYEADLHAWSVRQTQALRQRDLDALDWENVAEEIESLGSEQRNAWVSLCGRVIEHMLKIEHREGDGDFARWQAEIEEWREQMARRLKANPSLTGRYREIFDLAWEYGRRDAVKCINDWAGHPVGTKTHREGRRSTSAMLPAACPYRLLEVTAYDTELRKPEVRLDIMPPAVARILNERASAEYPVRPWPELDGKL